MRTGEAEAEPGLDGWERLIGRWTTQAAHPLLADTDIRGHATVEWLAGRRFLIHRWHYDHPDIPDAIAITGRTGGHPCMHYFDYRGVYRVYGVSFEQGQWRFWRDDPSFSQRFTGVLSEDGDTITGRGELSRDGEDWEEDLAVTYRRSPARWGPRQAGPADLNAMARRVIDDNHYLTLGTSDPDGRPRLSPVSYAVAGYSDFYWASSPAAQHSRNLAERPEAEIVIFDSTAPAHEGEAVYITAAVTEVAGDELERARTEGFGVAAAALRELRLTAAGLRAGDLRLYVGRARSCEVHVAAHHPVHGRGADRRQTADPGATG